MKAGAFTPATRQPVLRPPQGLVRSMKAGAFTPATQRPARALGAKAEPLNEGGGFHPRNPRMLGARPLIRCLALNEGGGFHPRNP